ncbi:uncharacterized protein C8Q71DRAFT_720094 [Rhodofomes roseus]|uniref:RRM domain-containing protein n=1 Tax=Rhodofomes roseus TaxID=34475 RepID=A0ABQ8KU28_9APHY|nr:uncharacterized protein C8Q71DRAFT_720094 [Rhodofomes roseus]KAH9842587.1 hypothetical protein C8Q71DRAFT_720094 [Rhodofomes roseus]
MASGVQRHVKATADKLLRSQSTPSGLHVRATNVPRTAIPADIKRVCVRHKIENVSHVALDYWRFSPTGQAWLTLTSPTFLPHTVNALNGAVISGKLLQAAARDPMPQSQLARTRGVKGRLEAAERGIITGSGPDGGRTGQGKGVVIYGLPGKFGAEAVRTYLKEFKLAASEDGQKEIVKLEVPPSKATLKSRFYVRLASVAEAHRLVRRFHMTFFEPNYYQNKYTIRAQVVY